MAHSPRWIIVSNRLPFQYDPDKKALALSAGGLVTAIMGIQSNARKIWLGAVLEDEAPKWEEATPPQNSTLSYDMLVLSNEEYDRYYNGFSNDVLWPLLHYQSERVQFRQDDWAAYQDVNRKFAEHIHKIARPGDFIWIHDFQLALVPQYLRALNPDLAIGWFLHVPFPSSEIYQELPVREELLAGILSSDLVGFQDYGYVRHFASSVQRVFGIEATMFSVKYHHHQVSLGVFPVSIDYNHFHQAAKTPQVSQLSKEYETGEFIFLGVDRLDYTKGVDLKLRSFYALLLEHPELHGKVSLIQVAVPTRRDVDEYMKLRVEIEQLVSEINGQFATPSWTPIQYLYHPVTFEQLMSLYRVADSLIVTSKRDGMNLVALEYVAAQSADNPGTVLISEFTGAKSFLSNAIPINPRDTEGTAAKMYDAIKLPKEQRQVSYQEMVSYLQSYTATNWGESFIKKLQDVSSHKKTHHVHVIENLESFADDYLNEHQNEPLLLILDYDGTLTPIHEYPEEAVLSEEMKLLLTQLSSIKALEILIISGRDQHFLMDQFKDFNFYLIAEHGAFFYDKKEWQTLVTSDRTQWYENTMKVMRDYTKQVPGSFIEQKSFGISWHYRKSPREFAKFQALKLYEELENSLSQAPARIMPGKKIIEVSAMEANKGNAVRYFLKHHPEFKSGFAIGDDRTDEDTFIALESSQFATIKVGKGSTMAGHLLSSQEKVFPLLKLLKVRCE